VLALAGVCTGMYVATWYRYDGCGCWSLLPLLCCNSTTDPASSTTLPAPTTAPYYAAAATTCITAAAAVTCITLLFCRRCAVLLLLLMVSMADGCGCQVEVDVGYGRRTHNKMGQGTCKAAHMHATRRHPCVHCKIAPPPPIPLVTCHLPRQFSNQTCTRMHGHGSSWSCSEKAGRREEEVEKTG